MLGLKACNSTKICTSHGQIFSVVIISFQKKMAESYKKLAQSIFLLPLIRAWEKLGCA